MNTKNINLKYIPNPEKNIVYQIIAAVQKKGANAFLVGGCVRNMLLRLPAKDIDIEVLGISLKTLESILRSRYTIDLIGKNFGVFKIRGTNIDVSLARTELSLGNSGHKNFSIYNNPCITIKEAAKRRDFTINAIYYNPLNANLIDPYQGIKDLKNKILRHTSSQFSEDSLRVLRGMQFIARFQLKIHSKTLEICRNLKPKDLPKERIFEEWRKLICLGIKPSLGLQFLYDCGWLQYFPELNALVNCPQDPKWHPEGSVWIHTLHCLDAYAKNKINNEQENFIVGLAVLCHDFGKPITTEVDKNNRIRTPRHDIVGVKIAKNFLLSLTNQKLLINAILPLVQCHMHPYVLYKNQSSDAAVRRLARKVKRIDRLIRVSTADKEGRPPFKTNYNSEEWLLKKAKKLAIEDSTPKAIILGRHLIKLKCTPGPHFKKILNICYEAQIEGIFINEVSGLIFLKKYLMKNDHFRL